MGTIRENWRIFLLIVVLLGSLFALFSPTMAAGDGSTETPGLASSGVTNLQYGLQLSGGTRIRAPLVGVTATDVEFGGTQPPQIEQDVAGQLDNVTVADVIVRRTTQSAGTVEVTVDGVTPEELGSALDAAGYTYESTRDGVTEQTRTQTVDILSNKINEAGLSGGTVQQISSAGENFILIEVPDENRQRVVDLVNQRGSVRVDAYYPTDGGYEQETVLEQDDFQSIGNAQQGGEGQLPNVPVVVREDVAPQFQQQMIETGVASQGGSRCRYETAPNGTDACLLLIVDGQVVNSFGMSPGLAAGMRSGDWAQDPRFILQTQNFSEAREVAINLRAGALPAKLDIGPGGEGTSSYIAPSQGQDFRTNSLLTGIIAVFAVAGVVFLRYGEVEVALPMIVTALSEVVILLGFAAGIGYPLDLSVIAGFIAVIGTGVDDLIIIADEVMAEGDVNSRRVFQSRFKKAFWVIGAAAATTIIAMSPLAVLSLGDLQGFAIFTILGVVVGVLLTRPAYGDILRALLTRDR
ncbi:preprotein translocase subunit SecD [Haloplanus aerogenes]|uniref:Protein-export membrane protein SecD n=1 Tax=Haloplanus aerogenes TaxID=660522 RepID=A0A3M0DQN7_9EURY|nr:preprotein translocase subunit SecD [Haloplanus aerogenes]AZH24420.1 preprotein translocase subunit SecD [Haloplanus aerogenes]RMB23937.1 preprotein translocase subunit SecD [Haloplanus aerogenes]